MLPLARYRQGRSRFSIEEAEVGAACRSWSPCKQDSHDLHIAFRAGKVQGCVTVLRHSVDEREACLSSAPYKQFLHYWYMAIQTRKMQS
jgi:hypothetical protein